MEHFHEHRVFDEETASALREIFRSFKRGLTDYLVTTSDRGMCATCAEAVHLVNELASIAGSALTFKRLDYSGDVREKLRVRYLPAFIYDTKKRNVRYYGLPSGQEFAPFIYVHKYIANDELTISQAIVDSIEEIERPLHVKLFVTPECPYCPYVVDALNQMGIVNDLLLVETIEAFELPIEADVYRIFYVPAIVVNDPSDWREYGAKPMEVINGYMPPEDIARILNGLSKRAK